MLGHPWEPAHPHSVTVDCAFQHLSVKAMNWQGQERTAPLSREVNVVFLWKCSSFLQKVLTHIHSLWMKYENSVPS